MRAGDRHQAPEWLASATWGSAASSLAARRNSTTQATREPPAMRVRTAKGSAT